MTIAVAPGDPLHLLLWAPAATLVLSLAVYVLGAVVRVTPVRTIAFGPAGISWGGTLRAWKTVERVDEDAEHIDLVTHHGTLALDKRALPSETIAQLRELLRANVP
jgi:hypothetical protein